LLLLSTGKEMSDKNTHLDILRYLAGIIVSLIFISTISCNRNDTIPTISDNLDDDSNSAYVDLPAINITGINNNIDHETGQNVDGDNISGKSDIATSNISSRSYYCEKAYLTVDLPTSWAASEGGEYLAHSLDGIVAFNSWNQTDFWAKAVQAGNTVRYSLYAIRDKVPDGGAYVVLSRVWGPPLAPDQFPDEYTSTSLDSLLNWDYISKRNDGQSLQFFKWGRYMRVDIGCNEHASNTTLGELRVLLESWQFDEIPAGDIEWAALQARELLPESVEPQMFLTHVGMFGPRYTEAEVDDDEIVHIRFIYTWNQITLPQPIPDDYQFSSTHWWTMDVLPDGIVVITGEGGAALPK